MSEEWNSHLAECIKEIKDRALMFLNKFVHWD